MGYETAAPELKKYEAMVIKVLADIVKHGYGEMRIIVSEVKGKVKTKIVICAGRSWVEFIEKQIPGLDKPDII